MNFAADRLVKQIDAIQSPVQSEMSRDAEFWGYNASSFSSNLEKIKNFAQSRQQTIMSEMKQFFSLVETAQTTLSVQGSGEIQVRNLPLDKSTPKRFPARGAVYICIVICAYWEGFRGGASCKPLPCLF